MDKDTRIVSCEPTRYTEDGHESPNGVLVFYTDWQEANQRANGCQCPACTVKHASDCAVHNMPAEPNGVCNCGALAASPAHEPAASPIPTDTAYMWWCPKCSREVDYRDATNEIGLDKTHFGCGTVVELLRRTTNAAATDAQDGRLTDEQIDYMCPSDRWDAEEFIKIRAKAGDLRQLCARAKLANAKLPKGG